jgi:putative peptide zinc metalloprotease protein
VTDASNQALPPLRQELRIQRAAPYLSGAPGWVVFDPVRHRYFQIGRATLEFLSAWQAGTRAAVSARMRQEFGRDPGEAEWSSILGFLAAHELLEPAEGGRGLARRAAARRHHWLASAVHNYLFFRIPLLRPQRLLDRSAWLARALFSPAFLLLTAIAGLVGLLLAARRWETFVATGLDLLSLEGALVFAACLPLVKTLHEMGHALMATRFGVKVPTMGIAFMVLAPFLYSDVSDAWRLTSRKQRLAIDAAGLLVELMLAAWALLLWVFLPTGPLQTAVFVLATTSLVLGLALNLNPFMRFDGYHLLADAVGVPNLQTRSMVVGRWALRELLFGVGAPCPEPMGRPAITAMALYAYAIWVYRFFLFLGIAILVYHMAFKALGVILFVIEIVWFIALPIISEVVRWWRGRARLARHGRAWLTFGCAAGGLALVFVPLPTSVTVPVVAGARADAALFAPAPGEILAVEVREGAGVSAGDVLVRLRSADLETRLAQEQLKLDLLRLRLHRIAADAADRSERIVLENQAGAVSRGIEGLMAQRAELVLRAPFAGRVRDLDPALRPGLWVGQRTALLRVVGGDATEFRGYVAEADLRRIQPGAGGRFVPDDLVRPSAAIRVESVAETAAESIDIEALASTHDGPLPVAPTQGKALRPLTASYAVVLAPTGAYDVGQQVRGSAYVDGLAESLAARLARRIVGVLIRESGA